MSLKRSFVILSLRRYSVFSTVQRYELWKYSPNFLLNSENIPNFAPCKEYLSDSGANRRTLQNNILKSIKVKA
jgi:hypothetical protein